MPAKQPPTTCVISEHGTQKFDDTISLKMPKTKQDTKIKPNSVFDGYREAPVVKANTVKHKKMAKKNPSKKKKDKTHKVMTSEPV
jgi:hypothetical protein|tara:strand:- start:58 stop:312 length:255 start_codon:yes stop_codon:yes gene_type:complete